MLNVILYDFKALGVKVRLSNVDILGKIFKPNYAALQCQSTEGEVTIIDSF